MLTRWQVELLCEGLKDHPDEFKRTRCMALMSHDAELRQQLTAMTEALRGAMTLELTPLCAADAGTGLVYHGVTKIIYDEGHLKIEQGSTIAWELLDPAHPMVLIVTAVQ